LPLQAVLRLEAVSLELQPPLALAVVLSPYRECLGGLSGTVRRSPAFAGLDAGPFGTVGGRAWAAKRFHRSDRRVPPSESNAFKFVLQDDHFPFLFLAGVEGGSIPAGCLEMQARTNRIRKSFLVPHTGARPAPKGFTRKFPPMGYEIFLSRSPRSRETVVVRGSNSLRGCKHGTPEGFFLFSLPLFGISIGTSVPAALLDSGPNGIPTRI